MTSSPDTVLLQTDALLPLASKLSLTELREAAQDINQRFQLKVERKHWSSESNQELEELHELLRQKIVKQLDRNPEKLMQMLYRMDVREDKVTKAFAAFPEQDLGASLAYLVLERQFQKMLLRQQAEKFAPPSEETT